MAIAAAVITGLRKLPREAVPETLEIVMQATGVDSVTLLSGLLRFVPAEIELAQVSPIAVKIVPFELTLPSGSFHSIPLLC